MGRSAIAAEATLTGSCNRGDRFRLHVDEPDGVIVAFGDVYVSLAVEAQLMRRVELRGCGRAAIAGIPLCSRTRKYRDFLASQVQPQQKMAAILHPVQCPIGPNDDPKWIVERRMIGEVAVSRQSLSTCSRQSRDSAWRRLWLETRWSDRGRCAP